MCCQQLSIGLGTQGSLESSPRQRGRLEAFQDWRGGGQIFGAAFMPLPQNLLPLGHASPMQMLLLLLANLGQGQHSRR